jgi:hypothetical protein
VSFSPIFLYTSWRTGGTAFLAATKANASNMVFYDPLNPALSSFESARDSRSEAWDSNHPSGIVYYEEYFSLYSSGAMDAFPDLTKFRFRNSPEEFKTQLATYIRVLIDFAQTQGKTPIFKFEQLEGHADFMRLEFPSSSHIGLIRDSKDQYGSFLEQFALGNRGFFDNLASTINGDLIFFQCDQNPYSLSRNDLFDVYYLGIARLRPLLDVTFSLYEDSAEEVLAKISSESLKIVFSKAFDELRSIENRPTVDEKFIRMRDRSINLIQERDSLIQERDSLIQERDSLIQERDSLIQED